MSHALCIAALSPDDIESAGGLEEAVAFQMEPFKEENTWFEDGSRWDWFVIGGRWTGELIGYEPSKDPDNYVPCQYCKGTGTRADFTYGPEATWARQPTSAGHPVIGKGCNACRGTGFDFNSYHLKDVGNVLKRGELKDETLAARAFLKDRRWCEGERMGWFGMTAKTECKMNAEDKGEDYEGRCLVTCEKTGAKIVTWDEEWTRWSQMFFPRFIRPLPVNTTLVVVDYHV